jgi:RNA recognition motif-containing protein
MRARRTHGNLFIANLPPDFAEARLAELFDPYGIVLGAEIARDPQTGVRLRHGWVDIATERAATAAIAGLHGTKLDGSRIEVRASERPAARKGAAAAPRRRPPASVARAPAPEAGDTNGNSAPPVEARPRPQFVVERRPLRRRAEPPAR